MNKVKMFVFGFLATLAVSALAAPVDGAPAAECDGVAVATGPKGKGYSLLFQDIKKVCGQKVALCEVNTTGGLDNLNAASTKQADVLIAPLDTINTMKAGDENIASLQSIMPLNNNYLHVVVASNGYDVTAEKRKMGVKYGTETQHFQINRFSDLRGKTVALVGTANLLARMLDKQNGLQLQFVEAKDDNSAFAMVRQGQVAAALTVSGWEHGVLKNMSPNDGLTLVPFDLPAGDPYKVKALNYKSMAAYNVNSLGVQNVLLTRPFSGARAAAVAQLQSCITSNLNELKEGRYQPAWNEVKISDVPGLTSFKNKK